MSNIVIIGDSHGAQLKAAVAGSHFFDNGANPITAREFVNFEGDTWARIDPWLTLHQGMDLVVVVGEVDIRGHYWRHIPRYNLPPEQYVQSAALALYRAMGHAINLFGLKSATLWAPPPAAEPSLDAYNEGYPFAGNIATRNRIIHLFNREFVGFLEPGGPIRFASAYYDYIDPDSYLTQGHTPTDGIHYRTDQYGRFFNELIEPCVQGSATVSVSNHDLFSEMYRHQFGIHTQTVSRVGNYDTWVSNEGIKFLSSELTQIHYMGEAYTFVPLAQRLNLYDDYLELTLKNR
jgi:hypothetical protein